SAPEGAALSWPNAELAAAAATVNVDPAANVFLADWTGPFGGVPAFDKIDLNGLLPPGNYFMRVALVDLLGFEGKFSAPRPLKIGGGR
nr:hypothetical protein [Elusimicrobiota bacterium]